MKEVYTHMAYARVRRAPAKRAVKVKSVYSGSTGRSCKKKRHLDINAPVGDFSPAKLDARAYRSTVER